MLKKALQLHLFCFALTPSFSSFASYEITPIGALRIGDNWTDWGDTQSVQVVEAFKSRDRFIADKDIQQNFGTGAVIGGEWRSHQSPWRFQAGISYDYLSKVDLAGNIWETGLPDLNELSYKYAIQHQRLNGELGLAWNTAKDYEESKATPPQNGEQTRNTFQDTTTNSFTWSAGVGIERSLGDSWRVGVGYLYTDAGEAKLEAVNSNDNLTIDDLSIHQALLQVTYLLCGL